MTRRKRTPSPCTPRKRVAFQIPDSLQQLSTLSRTLAQQADTLARVNVEDRNTGIIAQAQALGQSPSQERFIPHPTEEKTPSFRKFVPQKQDFPDTQQWVRSTPLPKSSRTSVTLPPSETRSQSLSESVSPAEIQDEPPVKAGEPLCLATQPQRIAALIAKKRAENEANRQREKWAQEQFAHRLSQAPDDQLRSELRSELNQESVATAAHAGMNSMRQRTAESQRSNSTSRNGIEQLRGYLPDNRYTHVDSPAIPSPAVGGPKSAASISPAFVDFKSRGEQVRSQPGAETFVGQLLPSANSTSPSANPSSANPRIHQPQVFPQPTKPIHYPSNTSYARQPVHQAPLLRNGPGYYRINPRLWNDAPSDAMSPSYSPQFAPQATHYTPLASSPSPYATQMSNLGSKDFRNLTSQRIGRYGVNGQFMQGSHTSHGAVADLAGTAVGGTT